MNSLGLKIKKLRQQAKLSQKEFGKLFNVAESTIGMYERGERKPDYDTLLAISSYFGVTTDYLLGNSNSSSLTNEEEFHAFLNNPDLELWYKELPENDEEDLEALRQMWEIIKKNKK